MEPFLITSLGALYGFLASLSEGFVAVAATLVSAPDVTDAYGGVAKYALAKMGLIQNVLREPLSPISEELAKTIDLNMEKLEIE